MIERYTYSQHYREDPYEELESALAANPPDSVKQTLEARLDNESRRTPVDADTINRIEQQLAQLALMTSEVEVAA